MNDNLDNTSLRRRGTRSWPAMPHHLPAKSKMATRGLKKVDQVWKKVQPQVIGPSDQLLLNKFFSCEATLWTAHVCLSVCIYVCHIPFFLVITNSIPSYLKEFHKCYKGVSWVSKGCPNGIPSLGWSLTNPRMVTRQPKADLPPEGSVLPTWNLVFRITQKNNTSWQLKKEEDILHLSRAIYGNLEGHFLYEFLLLTI